MSAAAEVTPIILVVDDDPMIRTTARATLERLGMRVEEADDGRAALEALDEHFPSLVILDVMMPGMNGFEVCRRIRDSKEHSRIPVFVLTGLNDPEAIDQAYDSGATDFITKPVPWPVLGERVRYMLRASRDRGQVERYETMLEDAGLAYWESPSDAERMNFSERSCELLGLTWAQGGWAEPEFMARVHPDDRGALVAARQLARERGRPYEVQYRLHDSHDNRRFLVERAQLLRDDRDRKPKLVGTCHDVTARRVGEEQIEHLANSDTLTGLPNRRLLQDRFEQALARARRQEHLAACLFLDLDRFKRVNDTLGHSAGDELLAETGRRLAACVRDVDTVARYSQAGTESTVARFGGDEFVVLLEHIRGEEDTAVVARRIQQLFSRPFTVSGSKELRVTPSIGIALFPRDGDDAESLLKHADAAMYVAKERGGETFNFFDQSMNEKTRRRLSIEQALHSALEDDQFVIHYQPLFSAVDGALTAVEALLRWEWPGHGLIAPLEFLPVAEETGLISAIGDWVIQRACSDWQALFETGIRPLRLAINLSAVQLRTGDLAAAVLSVLETTGFPAQCLEFELTEGLLIDNAECTHDALRRLKELGVGIALDDFGTGYSSLSHLKVFPIDRIKIDRSFVTDLTVDPDNESIINAIVAMGAGLRMRVVAEGVEVAEQLEILRECGCDEVQGYLLGQPLPLKELKEMLFGDGSTNGRIAA